MILGSKHVEAILKCFNVKFYIVHCWLIIKVVLRNARCNNEDKFKTIYPNINFKTIRSLGAELFHADGRTDGRTDSHDETNSRFRNFENAPKN